MVEGAGNKIAKYLLFAFNILFVIAGALLIVVGGVLQAYAGGIFHLAIYIIVVGGVILIVSFFGCCGAIKENRCMLLSFAVSLIVILLLCVAGTIVGFVFRNDANSFAKDLLQNYIEEYDTNDAVKKITDDFQQKYHCCGIQNYTDWTNNEEYNKNNSLPDSCCKTEKEGCGRGTLSNPDDKIYMKGCISDAEREIRNSYVLIAAVSASVALVMIIGVILACCLASAIHRGYKTV